MVILLTQLEQHNDYAYWCNCQCFNVCLFLTCLCVLNLKVHRRL